MVQASCAAHGRFEPLTPLDLTPGPRFSLNWSDGVFPAEYDVSSKLGGPLLLEFFFEGCRACRDNQASFHEVASEMAPYAGVFELSIDCGREALLRWVNETEPSWPVLSVCDRDIVDDLEVLRFPTTIVVDKNRQVILRHVGVWSPEAKEKIRQAIKREAAI